MCGPRFMTLPHDFSCRKRSNWILCYFPLAKKKVLEVKRRSKAVNALLFYFVVVADKESLFNFKWSQLLQFRNDLAKKIPLSTLEGLNWMPSNTHLWKYKYILINLGRYIYKCTILQSGQIHLFRQIPHWRLNWIPFKTHPCCLKTFFVKPSPQIIWIMFSFSFR